VGREGRNGLVFCGCGIQHSLNTPSGRASARGSWPDYMPGSDGTTEAVIRAQLIAIVPNTTTSTCRKHEPDGYGAACFTRQAFGATVEAELPLINWWRGTTLAQTPERYRRNARAAPVGLFGRPTTMLVIAKRVLRPSKARAVSPIALFITA
jgi:hypothetical protein